MLSSDTLKLDVAHLILLAVIVVGVLFVTNSCSLQCSSANSKQEGLGIVTKGCQSGTVLPKACENKCNCQSCADACYQRALRGELAGCGGPNPNYDQCNSEYRKCLLHGCGVASGNSCTCLQYYFN